jgi:hypothetical protein
MNSQDGCELAVNGVTVRLSRTSKLLYPEDHITKGDVIALARGGDPWQGMAGHRHRLPGPRQLQAAVAS